jgi:hypothetical protein
MPRLFKAWASEELRVIDQTIIQYIRESDAGVSSYSKPLPPTPVYLAPDKPFSGRFHASDGTPLLDRAPTDDEREDYIWNECMPTTASREIAPQACAEFCEHQTDQSLAVRAAPERSR